MVLGTLPGRARFRGASLPRSHAELRSKSLLTAGSLMLGSLFLAPSCADNNSSLFIVGVLDLGLSSCIGKPDNTGPFQSSGTLDTIFASGYTALVLVGNQLTEQGSREQLRTETSRVSLRGAEVQLTTLDGKALDIPGAQGAFSTVGTGFVDPAAGDTPSYATMAVNLIPPGLTGLPPQVWQKSESLAKRWAAPRLPPASWISRSPSARLPRSV